jgi:hypothetical protein
MVVRPVGLGTNNHCTGEDQRQFLCQSVFKVLIFMECLGCKTLCCARRLLVVYVVLFK